MAKTTIHIYSGSTDGSEYDLSLCGVSAAEWCDETGEDDTANIWIGATEQSDDCCPSCAESAATTHIIFEAEGDYRRMMCGARDGDDYTPALTFNAHPMPADPGDCWMCRHEIGS